MKEACVERKRVAMRSFDCNRLYERAWDTEILNLIAKIHEYKGRQDVFVSQRPKGLSRLAETAQMQSAEASNRIEGIVTTGARMRQLFEGKTTPRNRDEDEIMGYRDVLNTIHAGYQHVLITCDILLRPLRYQKKSWM